MIYVQSSVTAVYDDEGKMIGHIGVTNDITDKALAQIQLKQSEEKFRLAFDSKLQFVCLLDPEMKTIDINDSALKGTGFSKEEFEGIRFWETPSFALPELREKMRENLKIATTQEEPYLTIDKFLTKSGEERIAMAAYSKVQNDDGTIQYYLLEATDITDLKTAEKNLRRTTRELSSIKERFEVSTKAANIGIWEWNPESKVLMWNPTVSRIYGLPEDMLNGPYEYLFQTIHPEDRKRVENAAKEAIENNKKFSQQFRIVREDESIRHLKSVATVRRDENGKILGIVGSNWDITAEKEAEERKVKTSQLETRNKELEQFAYVASHDLQEPLRTTLGFVGLLEEGYKEHLDDKARSYLEYISGSAERMSSLVKGLLDYSRIGRNQTITTINTQDLVCQVLDDLTAQINESKAKITVSKLPEVQGSRTELYMLFQNLISNAIKFSRKDQIPEVTISARKSRGFWHYSIKDNGIGIAEEHIDKIFLIFQRLNSRSEYEGSGIGLAHCRKIADYHGGTLTVKSELNKGSNFIFTIPMKLKSENVK